MNYRHLGKAGIQVSELSFGSWVTFHTQVGVADTVEMMAAATNLGEKPQIDDLIGSIAAPMIAECHASRSEAELQALVHRVTRLTLLATVPLLLGAIAFGRPVLALFGEEFVVA